MIKNASKKSEVESEKIIKKYHKASSLKINTCFNALYEINHDKDEISPIPKKSLTPKHINYRKEKFPLIITQSIEFSTAIIAPTCPKPTLQTFIGENIFYKTPSPRNESSGSSSRYSESKKNIFLNQQSKKVKRSNTEKKISDYDENKKGNKIIKKNMHEKTLTEFSGSNSQRRYKLKIENLKNIKKKTHEEIIRLREKINSKSYSIKTRNLDRVLNFYDNDSKKNNKIPEKPPLVPNKLILISQAIYDEVKNENITKEEKTENNDKKSDSASEDGKIVIFN